MKTMSALFRLGAAVGVLCIAAPAGAVTLYSSLSQWQSTLRQSFETSDLGATSGSAITGFVTTDGVPVSVDDTVQTIGQLWGTWAGGYTGQVLANFQTQSLTFTLDKPVTGFGFFAEPADPDIFDITLTTSDQSVLTQPVYFDGGAAFFGWRGKGVTRFTVSSSDNFAVGEFYSATPEPGSWALTLVGFAGLGTALRRRRNHTAGPLPALR